MAVGLTEALIAAGGTLFGVLVTSIAASRNSELSQLRAEVIALRKVIDRRHTHLSAYARTLEIVCLAWRLSSLVEQLETIRQAKESLTRALGGSSEGGDSG